MYQDTVHRLPRHHFTRTQFIKTPFTKTPFTKTPFTETPFIKTPFTKTPFTKTSFTKTLFTKTPFTKTPFTKTPFTNSFHYLLTRPKLLTLYTKSTLDHVPQKTYYMAALAPAKNARGKLVDRYRNQLRYRKTLRK